MSRYPLEALLRPPVELWSALTASMAATVAWLAPWALLMPPALARVSAIALFAFALLRARQGWRVLRYQRHLRRLAIAVLGFLWIAYLAFAKFNEARQGKAEWAEVGVLGVVGAIVLIFASYLLTEASGVI